jgi:hypothetical protein
LNAEQYAERGHRQVYGWLTRTAARTTISLAACQQRLGVKGGVCEIGVHQGKFLILLGLLLQPQERALGIDLFENSVGGYEPSMKDDVLARLRAFGIDARSVDLISANSMSLSPQSVLDSTGPVRLFSVDGGHSAENTFNDLRLACGTLAPHGLVLLDDFFNPQWPGVAEGTCQFMAENPGLLAPVAIAGGKFAFARNDAEPYRQAIAGMRSTVFGQPVVVVLEPSMRATLIKTPLWQIMRRTPARALVRRYLGWIR